MNKLKTDVELNISEYRKAKYDKENELINKLFDENINKINDFILNQAKKEENIEHGVVEISYRDLFELACIEYDDFKLSNKKIREVETNLYRYFLNCGFKGTLLYKLDHYVLFLVDKLCDEPYSYSWNIGLKI